jgi:hypothetical protein
MIPLRIGIWFNPTHTAFGGPAQVLVGTMLGFLGSEAGEDVVLRLNEPGDINWIVDPPEKFDTVDWGTRGLRRAAGPLLFSAAHATIQDPNTSPLWRLGERQLTLYLAPSLWFGKWISHGLPFHDLTHHRPMAIWGAGVNTDWFRPPCEVGGVVPKAHTYFIYFKSQNWSDLRAVHDYLFANYFRIHGPVLMYYFYSHEELRAAATGSELCIFLDAAETQGLAALEIMACGCPLFVLDCEEYRAEGFVTKEATSVTCWSPRCGMKSSMARLAEDFPRFLAELEAGNYSPREFVVAEYSWAAAASKLRRLLETLP